MPNQIFIDPRPLFVLKQSEGGNGRNGALCFVGIMLVAQHFDAHEMEDFADDIFNTANANGITFAHFLEGLDAWFRP